MTKHVPDGWRSATLGDVCDFLDSQRVPVNEAERQARISGKQQSELYPYYGANGQVGWIDDYLFDEPLILLAEDGGKFGSATEPIAYAVDGYYWVNNHAHVLKPRPMIDFKYCLYSIRVRPDVEKFVAGTTRAKLNRSSAVKIPLLLPPLDEQHRIVRILDEAEGLRQLRARADGRMADFIPALFNQMFGDPATNPNGWPVVAMEELFEISPNYGTMIPPTTDEGAWLDLRVANIQDGVLDLSDKKYVDLPEKMVAKHEVRDGDLLLARAIGSQEHLGKCVIAYPHGEKWAFDSHLMRVRFSQERALSEFIRAFLSSASGRRIFLNSTRQSAVQFNINTPEFSAIRLPLPPLALQRDFAARVAEARALQDQQAQSRSRLETGFQALLHRTFAGEL